ncbi:hypothetical protein [Photobacterium leiognathi]|uniref:SnoaL-like domain-containing protein n=2 Tax=Photobacterium leiognathi TaxID=553611 RepID=X0NNA7_PHOLE|nr:hypothetical protein [Photobacterium leiognathi]KJF97392.1 hypothetical protein UB34_13360 [Photobacterium leiognathi]PSV93707.1 hypothetical protein CTM89_00235 [Photobacterium leiognathi]GAD29511.1 conserved hypothetical protein [Photobacterium leiognathi lrivu.4.1]
MKQNPYNEQDADRCEIWDMLVSRDINAYCHADWSKVENDFEASEFFAINANKNPDPSRWTLSFPSLELYRDEWLRQALHSQQTEYAECLEEAIHRATTLNEITIDGDRALARKQFNGAIKRRDNENEVLLWQTLYYLKRTIEGWKICGFTGYLPYTQ